MDFESAPGAGETEERSSQTTANPCVIVLAKRTPSDGAKRDGFQSSLGKSILMSVELTLRGEKEQHFGGDP